MKRTIVDNNHCTIIETRNGFEVYFKGGQHEGKLCRVNTLLGEGQSNTKINKTETPTWSLSMLPHIIGKGLGNVCPYAKTCYRGCLRDSGRGGDPRVIRARLARRLLYQFAREAMLAMLLRELRDIDELCGRFGVIGLVRLNVISDIRWERLFDMSKFAHLYFYDYTKWPIDKRDRPANYHLTFSYDGTNETECAKALESGVNVAIAYYSDQIDKVCGKGAYKQPIPKTQTIGGKVYPVVDGDKTDDRTTDPSGVIVGMVLKALSYKQRDSMINDGFAVLFNGGAE